MIARALTTLPDHAPNFSVGRFLVALFDRVLFLQFLGIGMDQHFGIGKGVLHVEQ